MSTTIERKKELIIKNFLMDKVFNYRPCSESDWDDFMNSEKDDEVDGFVLSEAYELDNALAIRGLLGQWLEEQLEMQTEIEKLPKTYILTDEVSGRTLNVQVQECSYGIELHPEGYVTYDGYAPVALDFFSYKNSEEDGLNVLVYSDNRQEEPTHKVSLCHAKQTENDDTL